MSVTRYRLIRRLADGRFHSGEALGRDLGISRAAVWKHLQGMRGLEVHAVAGRGYRLARPLDLLDRDEILGALPATAGRRIRELVVHEQIESTNSWLLERAGTAASGTVCLAEQQSAGRGRWGRRWVSPFGSNIYLSLLWHYNLAPGQLSGLSLAAGLAVLRALHRLGVTGVGLKWPNDVLAGDDKLAGVLLEVVGEAAGPSRVVAGVGLNTRMSEQQGADIDQAWTDLARLPGGRDHSRNRLAALLIENLVEMLNSFETQGLTPLVEEWNRFDLLRGRRVWLQNGAHRVEGIHQGIDPQGALLLARGDGIEAYHAGEVSLRGGA